MSKKVYIMRGPSGAGKSTYAKTRWPNAVVCSADHFHIGEDGVYRFNPAKAGEAHAACLRKFVGSIVSETFNEASGYDPQVIVVDNTNCQVAEIAPYASVALAYGWEVEIVNITVDPKVAASRNVHGCDSEVVERQMRNLRRANDFIPKWWKQTTVEAQG